MAYLKPPWFTRTIFNKIAMATGVGGSETLTVTKRLSMQPQKIPVVVPEVDGEVPRLHPGRDGVGEERPSHS